MLRHPACVALTMLCLSVAGPTFAAAPLPTGSASPTPSVAPPTVVASGSLGISGALRQERQLTTAGLAALPQRQELVKSGPTAEQYGGSLEWRGCDVAEAVGRDAVAKQEPDGFDRELDLYLVATGENGQKAWFSYGEVFLGPRGAFLIGTGYRHLIPHKHPALGAMGWDAGAWLTGSAADQATLTAKGCLACHAGQKPPAVVMPVTPSLVAVRDGWPGRFVTGLTAVEIRPVPQALRPPVPAQPKDTMFATAPRLLLPDGTAQELTAVALGKLPRTEFETATFGLGKGFHGIHPYRGVSLALVLAPLVKPADRLRLGVLALSPDGYRVLLSGGEIFRSERTANVFLVETEDGHPLGPGHGVWKLVVAGDFYVDRCVRSLAELRCFFFPE